MEIIKRIKKNAFARNSLVLFIGSMIANVLNYAFHVIIGRMISIEAYGEVESLISLSHIISVPALTLTMVVVKYSAGAKADNDILGSQEIWKVMNKKLLKPGLALIFIAICLVPWTRDFLKVESGLAVLFIYILLFISLFTSINNGILTGWQKFFESSLVGIIGSLIKLMAAVLLVKLSFGSEGVIGGFLLGGVATYIGTLFSLRFLQLGNKKKDKESKEGKITVDFLSMKKYILPAFLGTLAIGILGNVDMILAKHNLDAVTSGYYGALTVMSKAIFFATGAIATVLFSMSSEENHKKSGSKKSLKNAVILTSLVSFSAIAFYFVFPEFVITIFFGEKYFVVASYLGWFALMATLFSFSNLIIQYLLSTSKAKYIWIFLILALAEVVMVFFMGKNIHDILLVVSTIQIIAIIIGLRLVFIKSGNTTSY